MVTQIDRKLAGEEDFMPPAYTKHSQKVSPQRQRVLKRVTKKKLTPEEHRDQAIFELHQFYARQHIRSGKGFEEINKS